MNKVTVNGSKVGGIAAGRKVRTVAYATDALALAAARRMASILGCPVTVEA